MIEVSRSGPLVKIDTPPTLSKEEISARALQRAENMGLNSDSAKTLVVSEHAAEFRHQQLMTVQLANHKLLRAVHATGMDMVDALRDTQEELTDLKLGAQQLLQSQQRQALERECLEAHGQINNEEADTRLQLLTQFASEKTKLQLDEQAAQLKQKIDEQIRVQQDESSRRALTYLMAIVNMAQLILGGGLIISAIELALSSAVAAGAASQAADTISRNPLVRMMTGAMSYLPVRINSRSEAPSQAFSARLEDVFEKSGLGVSNGESMVDFVDPGLSAFTLSVPKANKAKKND